MSDHLKSTSLLCAFIHVETFTHLTDITKQPSMNHLTVTNWLGVIFINKVKLASGQQSSIRSTVPESPPVHSQ